MNAEPASRFECPSTDSTKDYSRFLSLLTTFEQLVVVSDQSMTDLTCTTARSQVSNCTICLTQAHLNSKCPHTSNLETFICTRNCHFHNSQTGHTNNGPHRKCKVRNRCFRSPNRSPRNQRLRRQDSLTTSILANRDMVFAPTHG